MRGDSLYTVYCHTTPNGKRYFGITGLTPSKRWRNGKGYYQNKHFSAAIAKYGWQNIEHTIIAEDLSKEAAASLEKELIREFKSNDCNYGYNNSSGGEKPSEGARWTEEAKAKNSRAHKGKKLTEAHCRHISEGKKGKSNGKEGLKGKLDRKAGLVFMIDEKTGKTLQTFFGYDEMSRETGYAKTPVQETVSGLRKRAYGYLWKYQRRRKNVVV